MFVEVSDALMGGNAGSHKKANFNRFLGKVYARM